MKSKIVLIALAVLAISAGSFAAVDPASEVLLVTAIEPTAALDSERARVVMDLLRQVARDQRAAILVVTHDEKIFDRFDRLIHLRDGRLVDS